CSRVAPTNLAVGHPPKNLVEWVTDCRTGRRREAIRNEVRWLPPCNLCNRGGCGREVVKDERVHLSTSQGSIATFRQEKAAAATAKNDGSVEADNSCGYPD